MTIKTIIELQAKPGKRYEMVKIMDEVIATMQAVSGFQGISRFEVIDNLDKLIEIAEWESPDARQKWVDQSMQSGVLDRLMGILGVAFRAINVRQIH